MAGDDRLRAREHPARPAPTGELDVRAGQGAVRPRLGDLAADQDAAGELDVQLLPDGPLGPGELHLRDEIRLARRGVGGHAEILARVGIRRESPAVVAAEAGGMHHAVLLLARGDVDHGARDRLAGVGGEDPALDDLGRLERQGDLLPGSGVGLVDQQVLPGEAPVEHGEPDARAAADAGDGRLPLVVGLDRPRPGAQALGRVDPPDHGALGPDLGALRRRPGHVDQPDADRLLGAELHVGRRPIGVGIQLDPAEAVAGRGAIA